MKKYIITFAVSVMALGASALFVSAQSATFTLPDGALIRAAGDIDVYIVKYVGAKKFKRLVLSPSVFDNYGYPPNANVRSYPIHSGSKPTA